MQSREFYRLFNKLLPPVLEPHGFVKDGSKKATFYRQTEGQVYHIITPWLTGRGGKWFDIKVLATSPLIEINFSEEFPDYLGMPPNRMTGLKSDGMALSASHVFRGNKSEGLIRNFNNHAKPAILKYAVPYLDDIQNLTHLRRNMMVGNHDLSYGLALWHTGKKRKARSILLIERTKFNRYLEDALKRKKVSSRDKVIYDESVKCYAKIVSHLDEIL